MAIKFEKIKPGMTLLDIHQVGNTTMRRWGCWKVYIKEVYTASRAALVSWNGNPPQTWGERQLIKLYAKEPKFYRERYKGQIW